MSPNRLVADIGGTNSRVALFDETSQTISRVAEFHNRNHAGLEDIMARWLETLDGPAPTHGCIAIAAPPAGDRVDMINIGWSFSCRELAAQFGLEQLLWLNDFQANAHALPFLQSDDLVQISAGDAGDQDTLATVGPGTGLGGATLRWINGRPVASCSEPGHAGLSPGSDLELEIFRLLLPEHGDIYAELLVSGKGLAQLYRAIALIHGAEYETLTPPQVSQRALQGEDAHCVQALDTFCALLGSACGDFVLANGAYGGLYIAGGIVPRMVDFLRGSEFLTRFQAKGAMHQQLASVPVQIIIEPYPGLIGAAHVPIQAT